MQMKRSMLMNSVQDAVYAIRAKLTRTPEPANLAAGHSLVHGRAILRVSARRFPLKSAKRIIRLGTLAALAWPGLAQFQEVRLFRLPGADPAANMACIVNNSGAMVAGARVGGVSRIYMVKDEKIDELLPLPGYDTASFADINDSGTVVGVSRTDFAVQVQGTIWRHGVPSPLPVPAPSQPNNLIEFRPFAMNNGEIILGQSVEYVGGSSLNTIVKLLVLNGSTFTEVPDPAPGGTVPVDINNSGDILVRVLPGPGVIGEFFLWRNGSFTLVEVPAGTVSLTGLNDQRDMLGTLGGGAWFLLQEKEVVAIPDLVGSLFTQYFRLNNKGETCGSARNYTQQGTIQFHQVVRQVRPSRAALK